MNQTIIVCERKEGCVSRVDDNHKEFKCKDCDKVVLVGESVIKQAQSKFKTFIWKPICMICFEKMPEHGKLIRPSLESINKMRVAGMYLDEVELRKIMQEVKNRMGSKIDEK